MEGLRVALEACGIFNISQSPMLGFHKEMDKRIKLLEGILSFGMQGVEFDNAEMYVGGDNAASDVRHDFVSVTDNLISRRRQHTKSLSDWSTNVSFFFFKQKTAYEITV